MFRGITAKSVSTFGTELVSGRRRAFFLSFLVGFVVRLIPEVLLSPYPIGFDSFFYAWRIKSSVIWYHWSQVFSTWLLYAILIPLYNVARLDLFVFVKLTAALLFGFNACGIYYFARKALGWTIKKGLLASVFFSLQLAALTFSSNFYRGMLGLGILLFTLPLIKDDFRSMRQVLVFMGLSIFVVLGHELSSVVLFSVFLGFLASRILKGKDLRALKRLIAVFPALALVAISLCLWVFPTPYEVQENRILVYEPTGNYQGALFFFKNYLGVYETIQYAPRYLDLASQIFSLFAFSYIVALPLVIVGFFRDNVLDSWTGLLLIGSLGALVMPFFALDQWWRWMLMLVYPFTFYAVNGITRILRSSREAVGSVFKQVKWTKFTERVVKLILILPFSIGLVLMPTVMQGTAVPLSDVDDTMKALQWLDSQMDDDSILLTHTAFLFLAEFYLDASHTRVHFKDEIKGAINLALQHEFQNVYFVWWIENRGWYGLTVPRDFVSVFSSGRMSVFKYYGSGTT